MEQLVNNIQTTLNGSITAGQTTLVVTSATGFSAAGTFRLLIDSEIMLCTAVSGTTLTIVRGTEGTAAAGHFNNAAVTVLQTAASQTQVRLDTLAGNYSNLVTITPPSFTGFSWLNQGNATITTANGASILTLNAVGAGSDSINAFTKAYPAGAFTYDIGIIPDLPMAGFNGFGIAASDGTKLVTAGLVADITNKDIVFEVNKFTNNHTFSAMYTLANGSTEMWALGWGAMMFIRWKDDNTNRSIWIGSSLDTLIQIFSVGRTDFLTPTSIGLFINNYNANVLCAMKILHMQ